MYGARACRLQGIPARWVLCGAHDRFRILLHAKKKEKGIIDAETQKEGEKKKENFFFFLFIPVTASFFLFPTSPLCGAQGPGGDRGGCKRHAPE